MTDITVTLTREQAMACLVALQLESPYRWRDEAMEKIEKALEETEVKR